MAAELTVEMFTPMGFRVALIEKAIAAVRDTTDNPRDQDVVEWLLANNTDTDDSEQPMTDGVNIHIYESSPHSEGVETIVDNIRKKALQKEAEIERKRKEALQKEAELYKKREQESIRTVLQAKQIAEELKDKRILAQKKDDDMSECLRSIIRQNDIMRDRARLQTEGSLETTTAYQTLWIYVTNILNYPNDEKYRKIRTGNTNFQNRVGKFDGGNKFLALCGFESNGEYLSLPQTNIDTELLKSAASKLNNAWSNPMFGRISTKTGSSIY